MVQPANLRASTLLAGARPRQDIALPLAFSAFIRKAPMSHSLRTLLLCLASLAVGPALAASNATPGVDQRQANQDQRIQQGVASGELNTREARRLNRQQDAIENAESRAKADGKVTAAERKRLDNAQDRASTNIAKQKHDRQKARH